VFQDVFERGCDENSLQWLSCNFSPDRTPRILPLHSSRSPLARCTGYRRGLFRALD